MYGSTAVSRFRVSILILNLEALRIGLVWIIHLTAYQFLMGYLMIKSDSLENLFFYFYNYL